jgi:signal transduction histidine kinase
MLNRSSEHQSSASSKPFSPARLGIGVQLYLGVLALALALLIVEAAAWFDTEQQARTQYEHEIEDGLDGFQADYERATRELIALGNWLIEQKTFGELIQARDSARLVKYLEPWTTVSIADSIILADKGGRALAQLGDYAPRNFDADIRDLPGMTDALAGKRVTGLAQDRTGRLLGRVVMPVYETDTHALIGGALLGFYLDGNFLQYRFRKLDQEIAVVYDERLYIITLSDRDGKPWGGKSAPALALKAQRENRMSALVAMDTDIGKLFFKFKPIQVSANSPAAMYGVGVSSVAIDALRFNLFRAFGVGILVIALGMGLGAFIFGRTLTTPIRRLNRAAQAMAEGDLAKPIRLARNDELGDLARQMDHTRGQLHHALETATLEHGRYAAVIQSMGAAAIISDHNLTIAAMNPAAEILLHQTQTTLLGQPWHHVFQVNGKAGNGHAPQWTLGETEVSEDQMRVVRGRFPLRANPQINLDVISTEVQVAGKPAGFVHILHDVSTQEQLVRAKDEFIMNAAHEFRGPLASLRASVELLVEDYATMDKQDLGVLLKAMQRAVVKFQGLVENMLDVGNIQVGRFRVRAAPIKVNVLIEDALAQVTPLLQGRAQCVDVKMESGAPGLVMADRARITQVIINLLTNASKYGPERDAIALSANRVDGFIKIAVTDRGPGIVPEEQANLFQRFYRGRRAEEEGIGIGLGLALAREIVQAHGGQIGVVSQIGEGTTFWFMLPRADASELGRN